MSDAAVFQETVNVIHAALEYAFNQGANGRFKPDRADAIRVVWQLVDLAIEVARTEQADV